MKNKLYIKDWLLLKPYNSPTITDNYYLKLCNKVSAGIRANKTTSIMLMYIDKKDLDMLACFLTSYFEDLISGTNLWNTFVEQHQKLYGKPIPFYQHSNYFEEEINTQDLSFLIWYYINSVQQDKFIAPYNDFIGDIADVVMTIFDQAWDVAPENEYLKSYYQIDENEQDYYKARALMDYVFFQSYLFYPDTLKRLTETEEEILSEYKKVDYLLSVLNGNRDDCLFNFHSRLLSLRSKEWTANILGIERKVSKNIQAISNKISGFFLYKGQEQNFIILEHIASGKRFEVTKKSFDHGHELDILDMTVYMSIVRWREEWWFSGMYFHQPYNADLILDEKNSIQSRKQVDFLDHESRDMDDILQEQLKVFIEMNQGHQIVFLPAEKINTYMDSFMAYFNQSLNLSQEEKAKAKQRAVNEGFFGGKEEAVDFETVADTALLFFNPKSGIEIAMGINSAFPLANNPYYDPNQSQDDFFQMMVSEEYSTELVLYCLEKCKDDLVILEEGVMKQYLEDLDFLLRFWKKKNYHTVPSVSFTGVKN